MNTRAQARGRTAAVELLGLLLAVTAGPALGDSAVMLGGNPGECDIARALLGSAPPGCPPAAMPPAPPPRPDAPPPPTSPAAPAPAPVAAAPPVPPPVERRAAFLIHFDLGSARIRPESRTVLDRVAQVMASAGAADRRFRVVGHTDATGTAAGNLTLSRQRAEAVRDYFTGHHHLAADRITVEGLGQSAPIDPATPRDPQNRRVEIVVTGP